MTRSKLLMNILTRKSHLNHKNKGMVCEVGDLIDGFLLIIGLGGDDNLGAFLTDLFENLINSLFEEIGCVRSFGFFALSAFNQETRPSSENSLRFSFS